MVDQVASKLKLNKNRVKLTKINDKEYQFKDLGPQVSWRTVFLIEYFGPILVHLYFALQNKSLNYIQQISLGMVLIHYLKREWETVFVHRFSNATMPWTNLPKNCFHYHVLGGLFIAFPLYKEGYQSVLGTPSQTTINICLGVWVFAQLSNLKTHLILRDLRPAGSTVRKVSLFIVILFRYFN